MIFSLPLSTNARMAPGAEQHGFAIMINDARAIRPLFSFSRDDDDDGSPFQCDDDYAARPIWHFYSCPATACSPGYERDMLNRSRHLPDAQEVAARRCGGGGASRIALFKSDLSFTAYRHAMLRPPR